jgi:hypothetical protein
MHGLLLCDLEGAMHTRQGIGLKEIRLLCCHNRQA